MQAARSPISEVGRAILQGKPNKMALCWHRETEVGKPLGRRGSTDRDFSDGGFKGHGGLSVGKDRCDAGRHALVKTPGALRVQQCDGLHLIPGAGPDRSYPASGDNTLSGHHRVCCQFPRNGTDDELAFGLEQFKLAQFRAREGQGVRVGSRNGCEGGHPRTGNGRIVVQSIQSDAGHRLTNCDGIAGACQDLLDRAGDTRYYGFAFSGQDQYAMDGKAAFNTAKAPP